MVTFLSYVGNGCHSSSGVAERLQYTHTDLGVGGMRMILVEGHYQCECMNVNAWGIHDAGQDSM